MGVFLGSGWPGKRKGVWLGKVMTCVLDIIVLKGSGHHPKRCVQLELHRGVGAIKHHLLLLVVLATLSSCHFKMVPAKLIPTLEPLAFCITGPSHSSVLSSVRQGPRLFCSVLTP